MKLYIHLFFLLIFFSCPLSKGMEEKKLEPLEVIVKNVGQGNCIIVKFPQDNGQYDIMLVDCGSSAYQTPLMAATHEQTPNKAPKSGFKNVQIKSAASETSEDEIGRKIIIESIHNDIGKNPIKAVVVTHPDKDHYGWIPLILKEKKWENLVLGGLPEKYLEASAIGDFLKQNIGKVHFTAMNSNEKKPKNILSGKYKKEPPQYNGDITPFGETFNFGNRFKVQVLATNSNHVQSLDGKKVINMSLTEDGDADHNTDSIVLKITDIDAKKSILLTGDATGITTTRLMDYAWHTKQPEEFLKADVLIASHHGSSSHGTNNVAWIQSIKPEYVIISTGGRHGHPTKEAFKNFDHEGLATVAPHSVFIGGISENKAVNYITTKGIFSTLPHGDITIVFPTQKNGKIEIISENSKTGTFTKEKQGKEKLESDIKIMPTNLETQEYEGSPDDLPEPESYGNLMNKFKNTKQHQTTPLLIDLNDPRNQFILDYLKFQNKLNELTESEKIIVKLTITSGFVGKVSVAIGDKTEETGLVIDLKDPRNVHLARNLNLIPSQINITMTTILPSVSQSETKEPFQVTKKKEKRERSSEESNEESKKSKFEKKNDTL
jgi:beta-lactamase superfamily II metal-dependent hydrolase